VLVTSFSSLRCAARMQQQKALNAPLFGALTFVSEHD
jgi:hypothetical protein